MSCDDKGFGRRAQPTYAKDTLFDHGVHVVSNANARYRNEGRHNMGGYRIGFDTDAATYTAMNTFLRGGRLG